MADTVSETLDYIEAEATARGFSRAKGRFWVKKSEACLLGLFAFRQRWSGGRYSLEVLCNHFDRQGKHPEDARVEDFPICVRLDTWSDQRPNWVVEDCLTDPAAVSGRKRLIAELFRREVDPALVLFQSPKRLREHLECENRNPFVIAPDWVTGAL